MDPFRLLAFLARAHSTHRTDDPGASTDSIRARLVLGLLLLSDGTDLIKIAFQNRRVWHVFGGFGKLEEDDARAYCEEAENDVNDLRGGAVEALEEDGRGDDGGGGEIDIVSWRY